MVKGRWVMSVGVGFVVVLVFIDAPGVVEVLEVCWPCALSEIGRCILAS